MRSSVLVSGLLLLGAATLVLVLRESGEELPERGARSGPFVRAAAEGEDRVGALERRLDELAARLEALRVDLERSRGAREPLSAPAVPLGAAPGPSDGPETRPAWYLEQYAASFSGGGQGSEYFRLAVQAFAPVLMAELGELATSPRADPRLRKCLVELLGDTRFRAHAGAIEICLRCLGEQENDELVATALGVLARIGDAATARALEGALASIRATSMRRAAIETVVALAREGVNGSLVRLWPGALDDGERVFLLSKLGANEGVDSLAFFEQAREADPVVRLGAAKRIGSFRFEGFPAFVAAWKASETDARVRAALEDSKQTLEGKVDWCAEQATGPPDAQADRDDPKAWASAQADMGLQWLELGYDPPLSAHAVRIHEVNVAGALVALTALDERGGRHELWAGRDPNQIPGVLELTFSTTRFRVRALRLTLDTGLRPGWSEIDAVELIGPAGRAWASSAHASSSYGQ